MEPTYTSNTRRTTIDLKMSAKAAIHKTQNFDQQGKTYNRVSTFMKTENQAEKINAKHFADSNSSGRMKLNNKYLTFSNSSGSI